MSAKIRNAPRLAVLGLSALLLAAPAFAMEPPRAGQTDGIGAPAERLVPQAPIGHRQPRAADIEAKLPPDELAARINRLNRELDRKLQICRGC